MHEQLKIIIDRLLVEVRMAVQEIKSTLSQSSKELAHLFILHTPCIILLGHNNIMSIDGLYVHILRDQYNIIGSV